MAQVKSTSSRSALVAFASDDDELSFNDTGSESSLEKDETELELEKYVFGDEAGFQEGIDAHGRSSYATGSGGEEEEEEEEEDHLRNDQPEEEEAGIEGVDDGDLFFLDSGPSAVPDTSLIQGPVSDDGLNGGRGAAAWVDSDDERIIVSLASNPRLRKLRVAESENLINGKEYTKRLRRQFERLYPVPDWANPSAAVKASTKKRRRASDVSDGASEDSSADDMSIDSVDLSVQPLSKLLQNAGDLIKTLPISSSGGRKLRPEFIDIQRAKDVGVAQPSAVTSLNFHPLHPLLLSSGPASTLFLHHISPHPSNPNPLLTSLHLRSTPLSTSAFLPPHGSKIFFAGRRRHFHTWDLSSGKVEKVSSVYGHANEQRTMENFKLSPCGRWMGLVGSGRKGGGMVNVLDARTCQWVAEVHVEGRNGVADFAWWGDGEGMLVLGKGGEAVEWDRREKRVIACWVDDGAIGTAVVALGGHVDAADSLGPDRWLAVGSSSGIVNVYDRKAWSRAQDRLPRAPKPTRAFDHLTTTITNLAFSPDGQLLVLASRFKRDALRLVHLPTCTVYKNWPTSTTPLGRVSALAFAPLGLMLAVANEQGLVRLWEIR